MAMTQEKRNLALLVAVEAGDLEKVRDLVAEGAGIDLPDKDGNHPLHWAAEKGHLPVVELLLEKGARIDASGSFGAQPLHAAARNGHLPVVEFLVGKGAKIDAGDEEDGQPIHVAAWEGRLSVVEFLLENGADPNAQDRSGQTAADLASSPKVANLLKRWSNAKFREKRQQARQRETVRMVRAHWKRMAGLLPKPGPGL